MSPGDDMYFRLFLSSRWGTPLSTIDALPASEFIQHKLFWQRFKWGLVDDLLALCVSQVVSFRSGSKPQSDLFTWKELALQRSGQIIKKVTDNSLKKIRHGFMMLANVIGKRKD
jgi:hypothetical protein